MYYEVAQIEERAGNIDDARTAFRICSEHFPRGTEWKVWIAGSRLEVKSQNLESAWLLLARALVDAPRKARASVFIEMSRLREYERKYTASLDILEHAKKECGSFEWKVRFNFFFSLTLIQRMYGRSSDLFFLLEKFR